MILEHKGIKVWGVILDTAMSTVPVCGYKRDGTNKVRKEGWD